MTYILLVGNLEEVEKLAKLTVDVSQEELQEIVDVNRQRALQEVETGASLQETIKHYIVNSYIDVARVTDEAYITPTGLQGQKRTVVSKKHSTKTFKSVVNIITSLVPQILKIVGKFKQHPELETVSDLSDTLSPLLKDIINNVLPDNIVINHEAVKIYALNQDLMLSAIPDIVDAYVRKHGGNLRHDEIKEFKVNTYARAIETFTSEFAPHEKEKQYGKIAEMLLLTKKVAPEVLLKALGRIYQQSPSSYLSPEQTYRMTYRLIIASGQKRHYPPKASREEAEKIFTQNGANLLYYASHLFGHILSAEETSALLVEYFRKHKDCLSKVGVNLENIHERNRLIRNMMYEYRHKLSSSHTFVNNIPTKQEWYDKTFLTNLLANLSFRQNANVYFNHDLTDRDIVKRLERGKYNQVELYEALLMTTINPFMLPDVLTSYDDVDRQADKLATMIPKHVGGDLHVSPELQRLIGFLYKQNYSLFYWDSNVSPVPHLLKKSMSGTTENDVVNGIDISPDRIREIARKVGKYMLAPANGDFTQKYFDKLSLQEQLVVNDLEKLLSQAFTDFRYLGNTENLINWDSRFSPILKQRAEFFKEFVNTHNADERKEIISKYILRGKENRLPYFLSPDAYFFYVFLPDGVTPQEEQQLVNLHQHLTGKQYIPTEVNTFKKKIKQAYDVLNEYQREALYRRQ